VIEVPPLRARLDDLPSLAAHFMARVRAESGLSAERISSDAMDRLVRHAWTANVRELQNVLHRAMLACDGRELRPEHLPAGVGEGTAAGDDDGELIVPLAELEKREIIKALHRTRGNVTVAATQLGIGRATLYRRVAELKLVLPEFNPERRVRVPVR
jgi:DNA-binding NtrC family response regulator